MNHSILLPYPYFLSFYVLVHTCSITSFCIEKVIFNAGANLSFPESLYYCCTNQWQIPNIVCAFPSVSHDCWRQVISSVFRVEVFVQAFWSPFMNCKQRLWQYITRYNPGIHLLRSLIIVSLRRNWFCHIYIIQYKPILFLALFYINIEKKIEIIREGF